MTRTAQLNREKVEDDEASSIRSLKVPSMKNKTNSLNLTHVR